MSSKNVQSVAVINNQGRVIEKDSKPKFTNQFPENLREMFFMHCVLQISIGKDFDDQYGPINYHISQRSNLTMLTFPVDDHVVLVTINKNISPILLARKIINIIDGHKKERHAMMKFPNLQPLVK